MRKFDVLSQADMTALLSLSADAFSPSLTESQAIRALTGKRESVYGLWEAETLIAYAWFSTVLDEAELLQVAVSPHYRRQGLAASLLSFARQQLNEQGVVRELLEVRASNDAAIALYHSLGYVQQGIRKDYYASLLSSDGAREDALLLEYRV